MTGGNDFYIQGLPYTASSDQFAQGAVQLNYVTFTDYVVAFVGPSDSVLRFIQSVSGNAWGILTVSDFLSGSANAYFTITYFTD
jgi:hypothetical protein